MARILFFDDDPLVLNMLSKVVRLSGHEPLTSGSPASVPALAEDEQPDLIVLGIHPQNMESLAALEGLRAQETTKTIPTLMLLAGQEVGTVDQILDAGAQGYLEKPLKLANLLEVIREYTTITQ